MTQDNQNEITIFAETTFRNQFRRFGIKTDDRRRHVYIVGKTGMGKTTLIENMVYSDILAGKGVCYIDPHGDTAEKILGWIPSDRINDVIYFNPADINHPISFNVLEKVEPHYRHLIASGLIGVFKKLWADSWGPRLEYLLRNTILALLEFPDSTLLGINRMLVDKEYRKKVLDKVQDPVVKQFWTEEYAKYGGQFQVEAISPIQNKVGQFLSTSLIRNIVGQVKSSIDLRKVMDEGKILILNLSKGRIGEDASALLGSMLVTKIQLASMSRVDVPEEQRKDFYLYVDEFQNFATDSFADILSEARKYRLNLIIAHQYIEQLGEVVKPAVFGNVGTIICFRVGAADAEELVKEFTPVFTEEDLVNLPKYEVYLKLMIDGVASEPFSARGLPPLAKEEGTDNREKAIKVSRERYTKSREVVEDKIVRWHSNKEYESEQKIPARGWSASGGESRKQKAENRPVVTKALAGKQQKTDDRRRDARSDYNYERGNNKENGIYKYKAICSRCGKQTKVSFAPDGVRPVFCKECLTQAREEKRVEIETRKKAKTEELAGLKREELSLNRAMRGKPVDFQGKEIIESRKQKTESRPAYTTPFVKTMGVQKTMADEQQKRVAVRKNKDEGELREGEKVKF